MTLRVKIAGGRLVAAPGISDVYSALLVQHLGFDAAYLGGNALGLALGKGQPFVDARDVVDAVSRITAAVDIPLIVDAATGFGDAAHTHRVVRDLEAAGAAALHIDDQVFPKRAHYHRGVAQLAPAKEVAGKLDHAVRARRTNSCMIIARSDVLRIGKSLDTHLDRLRMYAECGIDGLLVLGSSLSDAALLAREFPNLPLFWTATLAGDLPTLSDLAASPYAVALYPFHGVCAMTDALMDVWGSLKNTERPGNMRRGAKELVDMGLRLVDMPLSWEIEEQTLGPFPKKQH